jgi:hypothetical protein
MRNRRTADTCVSSSPRGGHGMIAMMAADNAEEHDVN